MEYQEFLDYIYQRHSGNVKFGLDRMYSILKLMGNPEQKLQGIHVAGTNGKGSTSAMCEAIMLEHGYKTGMNTSPHLIDYRERIRVNGKNILLADLIEIYKKWESVFKKTEASFFEITTSMAFYWFMNQNIDVAIFEVGLGGRLDGTRPFNSDISAITSISLDHPKSLGNDIKKIAFEKAGIIKENQPVVLGNLPFDAISVIKKVVKTQKSKLYLFGKDFTISNIQTKEDGTHFDYIFPELNINFVNIRVNLIGKHQALNCSVAITSFLLYMKKKNLQFSEMSIRQALEKVNWQGRMQVLGKKPIVIIDGAHNEEGVNALVDNLKNIFPHKKIKIVLAILRDKNLDKMIQHLCTIATKIYLSKNKSKRAAEIEDLTLMVL